MKLLPLTLFCATVTLVAATSASGQVPPVYEPFNYPAGAVLHAQSGGRGFSGPWYDTSYYEEDFDTIRAGNLPFGLLITEGNSLKSQAPAVQFSNLSRPLLQKLPGTPGTALWVSFLMRRDANGSATTENYFGLTLYPSEPNAPALYIGDTSESEFYSLAVAGESAGQVASSVPCVVSTTPTFLVVKIAFRTGAELIQLFVNPNPVGPEPTTPSAVKADFDLGDVSVLGILGGLDAEWSADEIRIGRSFADVAPKPDVRITSVKRLTNGTVRLNGVGVPSSSHTIQAASALTQPFATIGSVITAADGTFQYDDASATALTRRFYRVVYP